jgi:hypothetical protein
VHSSTFKALRRSAVRKTVNLSLNLGGHKTPQQGLGTAAFILLSPSLMTGNSGWGGLAQRRVMEKPK